MFRPGTNGRHRHAIGVAVRVPEGGYEDRPPEVEVTPGADARLVVRAENRSGRSAQIALTVEGVPAGWAEVLPETVRVDPSGCCEADVCLRFPEAPDVRAAEWPIRVVAFAEGRRMASAPALVRVAPHPVLSVELDPSELRARRRARAEVRVTNSGDAPADVDLAAAGGRLDPPRLHVPPGETRSARLEVRAPRRWFTGGDPTPVHVEAAGASAEGTFRQRPTLPPWALVLPMLIAAAAGWFASRPNQVAVPRVTGMSVSEARQRLAAAGLRARQAPLPAPAPKVASAGVVRQDPPPGEEVANGGDVMISYYEAEGMATVTPKVGMSSVGSPSGGGVEPLAYARGNRILVSFPGEAETPVAGAVGTLASDPAWDPRTGELAFVRRATTTSAAEVVAVDPHTPGAIRLLTEGEGSYVDPAFAPDGGRLAVIAEDGSGYGGALCVVVPPARAPRCQADDEWHYARPAWGEDGLVVLRRKRTTQPTAGGWEEVVRTGSDLKPAGEPIVTGDVRSVAVAGDGRLAVVARENGENAYRVQILSPAGEREAVEPGVGDVCEAAWAGDELVVSRGTCTGGDEIVRLSAGAALKLADGSDPAVAG